MNTLRQQLRRMKISVVSPDQTVKATLVGLSALDVELASGATDTHTDSSLATQLAKALTAVMSGHTEAVAMLREQQHVGRPIPDRSRSPRERTRARLRERVDTIEAVGESMDGDVLVDWRGHGDVDVFIRSGTLRRLDERELHDAVNAAVSAARAERAEKIGSAFRDIYMTATRANS